MQIDRQLFEKTEKDNSLPVVRVYQWELPTITYGCNQKIETLIDLEYHGGWQVLKRSTGGGIVFHRTGEISFTVIISRGVLNITQALAQTSEKVAKFIKSAGLEIKVEAAKRSKPATLCADFVSSYEITLEGKKLVGIAQRFGRKAILQQGTIFGCHPQIKAKKLEEALKNG